MRTSAILTLLVLAIPSAYGAANTSFEESTDSGGPAAWTVSESGFEVDITSDVAYMGNSSVRFTRAN